MQTLHVELGERRYPIFIGSQLDPETITRALYSWSTGHDCE